MTSWLVAASLVCASSSSHEQRTVTWLKRTTEIEGEIEVIHIQYIGTWSTSHTYCKYTHIHIYTHIHESITYVRTYVIDSLCAYLHMYSHEPPMYIHMYVCMSLITTNSLSVHHHHCPPTERTSLVSTCPTSSHQGLISLVGP